MKRLLAAVHMRGVRREECGEEGGVGWLGGVKGVDRST